MANQVDNSSLFIIFILKFDDNMFHSRLKSSKNSVGQSIGSKFSWISAHHNFFQLQKLFYVSVAHEAF